MDDCLSQLHEIAGTTFLRPEASVAEIQVWGMLILPRGDDSMIVTCHLSSCKSCSIMAAHVMTPETDFRSALLMWIVV